jgi:small subunit ribosomal protein S19
MSRSTWKGAFIAKHLLKKKKKVKKSDFKKIWSRNSTIPISCINTRVLLYNGHKFNMLLIKKKHIGLKFGEFSFTRKRINREKIINKKSSASVKKNIKK